MSKLSVKIIFPLLAVMVLVGVGCAKSPADSDTLRQSEQNQAITDEEQAFLDSGNAKAYDDETDAWPFYENHGVKVSYPLDIDFASDVSGAAYRLDVQIDPVAGLDMPMGFNEETARANMTALAAGEYGDGVDFSLTDSERVRSVSGTNAQDFLVLGRFEVCDVTFERKLYFFHNDQQVVLTLSADEDILMPAIPEYLATDEANCGDQSMWIFDQQSDFYAALVDGTAPPIVQSWYDLFDQIVETIELGGAEEFASLDGVWRATDDESSSIEFARGHKMDFYNDELMGEGSYILDGNSLVVTEDDLTFEYKVMELTEDSLVLTYLARGNTLEYTRE